MRLTYEEAHSLSLSIAQLLIKEVKEQAVADTTVVISGGPLRPSESE